MNMRRVLKATVVKRPDQCWRWRTLLLAKLALCTVSLPAGAQSIESTSLESLSRTNQAASLVVSEQSDSESPDSGPQPFGTRLFTGGFGAGRVDILNPDYVLQPGDRVVVRIWGATEFSESLTLDPQGKIFLPTVGPVHLAGVANQNINERVTDAIDTVYTDQVHVYTSLEGSQPIAVFVTGNVEQPGRYAGVPSSSLLHFLAKAGGVDAEQGSYRKIEVLRDGQVVQDADLYRFLISGELPGLQFRDGDTIVVHPRGNVVTVTGDVRNSAVFELGDERSTGRELLALAHPMPAVSHAGLTGIRSGIPFSRYMTLRELQDHVLMNGDLVHVRADNHDQVIVVDVEGAHAGPTRYAVPNDTRLNELLDYIEVDRTLANVSAVSIKRASVAQQQKAALESSLKRLESRYLTASSQTDQEASIRAQEAQLIGQFVENTRGMEPNGRLVVARRGEVANILLQSGDTITIPATSDSVLLSGEVLVSQAILYEPGLRALDYIVRAGGFSAQADRKRILVVHANGEVNSGENPLVLRGDEIIVLPKVPVKHLQIASTIVDILYKIAIATSVAVKL